MPPVTLPIRIRPNRVRVLLWTLAWGAVSISATSFCLQPGSPIPALLMSPQLTLSFAGAVLVAGCTAVWLLLTAGCALAALPRAPFFYIQVDEQAVTERFFWRVRRRALRDVDSWGTRERPRLLARQYVPVLLYHYSVVPLPQGRDPQRAHRQPRTLLEIETGFFHPPFAGKAMFAQELADCLTAAVTGAKQSRRPVSIDISPGVFAQTFQLRTHRPKPYTPKNKSQPRAEPARLPGRFPTNQHREEYWRSQAIQSAKASDDNPYTQHASERAEFYRQMAKRDRKRLAREKKAKKSVTQSSGDKSSGYSRDSDDFR